MEIKKLSSGKNSVDLLIKDSNYAFVNAIRRTIMNSIPVLAAENIIIYENSSVLFDEFLGQRIAMLPIKTDTKRYKEGETVKLVLETEGPGTVYSKDIKSTDPNCEIAEGNIPLAKLKEGQKIKLEIEAVMGKGKDHVKWQPANAYYRNIAKISTKAGKEQLKKIVESCPKNILEIKSDKLVFADAYKCDLCGKCRDASNNEVNLSYDENSFIFTIENHGNISAEEIFSGAVKEIKNKLEELKKEIKKI
ncbi:MAG: DNA-directed RNA polymerase subunit D [Candidatus Diapherotrites archaeon]|nr:DNA-directed RNA polymerase subunit D [Candidatus Diapherotrites archaeon]